MNVLIIGAKGFIGSHLVEYFSGKGEFVVSCDVKEPGAEKNYFNVTRFDSDYSEVLSCHKFDVCINAGGNGSVPYSIEHPQLDFHLNLSMTDKLLSLLAVTQPSCKFIHISSAAVYGSPDSLPISENEAIKPLSPYGWHKYMAECVCRKFSSLYKLQTCSLRVFSVFGERLTKQLFWDIYRKIKISDEIVLFGNGEESRDFIYIHDLIRAIDLVLQNSQFTGEAINVSSGIETTVKTAAELICDLYGSPLKIRFNNERKPGDPTNWRADITKLTRMGFAPSTTLQDGLKRYVKWLKENE